MNQVLERFERLCAEAVDGHHFYQARAWDQSAELDQKKKASPKPLKADDLRLKPWKVLDKMKKEEQWSEDDAWRLGMVNLIDTHLVTRPESCFPKPPPL